MKKDNNLISLSAQVLNDRRIEKNILEKDIKVLAEAVEDTFFRFDQDDYCLEFGKMGNLTLDCDCFGCKLYQELLKAHLIALKYLTKKR